jgi:hypothetical protein
MRWRWYVVDARIYIMTISNRTAGIGVLLALPFLIANAVVALRIEPFYSVLGTFGFWSTPWTVGFLLILILAGALIALRPVVRDRKFHSVNTLVALVLVVSFMILSSAIGEEVYRCDVLKIENCD